MNADRLLAHFERISEAPDAVDRLRRFVLDLAVRGKLVQQDVREGTAASVLAEDRRPAKGSRQRLRVDSSHRVLPAFSLPSSWAWVTVDDAFEYDAGIKREPKDLVSSRWLLELEDIEKSTSKIVSRLTVQERDPQSTKSEFQAGDILYGKLRPYLNKVVVADQVGYSTTEIVAIRPRVDLCRRYCQIAFQRPDFVAYVERLGRGTKMPRLRTPDALVALFPLPPLAEQHRIVEKVDELMLLCDRLEASRNEREARRDRLVVSSLNRLGNPSESDPEDFKKDARFHLTNLNRLSTKPEHIKELRKAILNLAVRGKLVPQDESEGIANGYAQEPEHGELPKSWKVLSFGRFCDIDGGSQPPKTAFSDEPRPGYVRLFQIRDLGEKPVPTYIPEKMARSRCKEGDILIGRYGASVGKIFWAKDGAYNVAMAKFIYPPDAFIPPFAFLLLRSRWFQDALGNASRSAQAGFNKSDLKGIEFPLPPLAEQKRIVAKVDELMAICDQLEKQLESQQKDSRRLLEALLHEALEGVG